MGRKKIIMSIMGMLVIGFGWIIIFGVKSEHLAPYSAIKESTVISGMEKSFYKTNDSFLDYAVQLDYPREISYPQMNQFDISISNYSADAAYCKVAAQRGSMSAKKIYLEKENQITYYFPGDFGGVMSDAIQFEFYDENARLIDSSKIFMEYHEAEEKFVTIDGRLYGVSG